MYAILPARQGSTAPCAPHFCNMTRRQLFLFSALLILSGCSRGKELKAFQMKNVLPVLVPPQNGTISFEVSYECPRKGLELVLEVDGKEYDHHEIEPGDGAQQHTLAATGVPQGEHRTEVLVRDSSGQRKSLTTGVALVQ